MPALTAPGKLQSLWRRPLVWRLLLVALLAEIGYAVLNISTMPVYLKFDRKFDPFWIGMVLTSFLLSEAVFKSYMGHLADRFGHRLFLIFGPFLTVGTSLLSLAIPYGGGTAEVFSFIMLRIIDGIGAAMLWPAAFAAMGNAVGDDERQEAMSMLNSCYLLGVALALPIGGMVNDLSGVRWASLLLAAVLFASVGAAALRFPIADGSSKVSPAEVPTQEVAAIAEKISGEKDHEVGIGELVGIAKQIPSYLLLATVTFAGVGFPMAIIKLFSQEQFQMSESAFGLLVLPAALAMAALSVPMSKLGQRIGNHRAVHLGLGLCAGGMAFIALGAIIPPLRGAWALALGGLPLGIGFLLAIPAWMASVSDIDPLRRAANIGAIMTAQGVGAIIGAPIGAACYSKLQTVVNPDFGRYSPFIGCAICVGAGWALSLKILKPEIQAHQEETNQVDAEISGESGGTGIVLGETLAAEKHEESARHETLAHEADRSRLFEPDASAGHQANESAGQFEHRDDAQHLRDEIAEGCFGEVPSEPLQVPLGVENLVESGLQEADREEEADRSLSDSDSKHPGLRDGTEVANDS